MGLFIEFPGAEAFVNCTDNYLAHRERRNLWEFYQIPGVLDALAASGARAAGAPLFEEERQVAESDLLPGNVEGLEFLHCVYGPIGSEQDAVLQEFNF